jgi:hypothetical protein
MSVGLVKVPPYPAGPVNAASTDNRTLEETTRSSQTTIDPGDSASLPVDEARQNIERRRHQAIAACFLLLVFQGYWSAGSNLLSGLPNPPAPEADIIEGIITVGKNSQNYALWVIRRQGPVEGLVNWVRITDPLDWSNKAKHPKPASDLSPKAEHPEPIMADDLIEKVAKNESDSTIDTLKTLNWEVTKITEAKYRMDLLQQLILPPLYGWIGALVYIMRSLSEQIRLGNYRNENTNLCDLRILLGVVAGLAIGWFFRSSGTEVNGIGLVSPFALAFVAGYSVEPLFTAMDRIGTAISAPGETPKKRRDLHQGSSESGAKRLQRRQRRRRG